MTFNDFINFNVKHITWDFDQILVDSETPIKKSFFEKTGIDYRDRKIDQWLSLSNWASNENKMKLDEVSIVESEIWDNADVLKHAKPIPVIQHYSKLASKYGVKQSVVSSRHPKLLNITIDSIRKNYPWIDTCDVHLRTDRGILGDEFKGKKVGQLGSNVHVDDSIASTVSVLKNSNAFVILFPRSLERNRFEGNKRVLEFMDMTVLNDFIR